MRFLDHILITTLKSWTGVIAYACAITLFAFTVALVMVALLFSEEANFSFYTRATLIVLAIAPGLGVLAGWHLLRITKLSEEMERLVNRDRLTDVATRDYFFKRMRDAPDAYGVSLMIDIDHFKEVNDTYGHLAGDTVIATVAQRLSNTLRNDDIICRFGGEEFVVFLSGRNIDSGYRAAERMRNVIARDALEIDGLSLKATVSIGGSLKDRLTDIEAAIHEADAALYRAKAAGRNLTVFADAPETEVAQTTDKAAAE